MGVRATVLPTPPPLATAPDARPPSLSAVARTGGDTGRHPAPPPPPRVKPASTTRRGAPKATSALAVVRTTPSVAARSVAVGSITRALGVWRTKPWRRLVRVYRAPRSETGSKREVIRITSHSPSPRRQVLTKVCRGSPHTLPAISTHWSLGWGHVDVPYTRSDPRRPY